MRSSEIIRKAKEILFERGHARANLIDEHGQVCMLGAVAIATGINPDALLIQSRLAAGTPPEGVLPDPYLPFYDTRHPSHDVVNLLARAVGPLDDYDAVSTVFIFSDDRHGLGETDEVFEAFDKAEKLALVQEENA